MVVNLTTILSAALALDGFILHFVGKGLLTGADRLPEQIGIHHTDHGIIIPQHPDNHRHLPETEMLRGIFPAVSGDDLIHTFRKRADDQRIHDTVFADALDELQHLSIRFHLKWMVPELPQALHFDLHDLLVRLNLVYINRHKHTFLPARFVHLLTCRPEPEQ